MNFDALIKDVLKREGGYVDHKYDRGGATNHGITQRVYTMWRSDRGIGYLDVRNMSIAEASAIYREHYWLPSMCEILPPEIRDIHFDSAVNHGVNRAAKLLQDALGVKADGLIGKNTLASVAAISLPLLRARYLVVRYRFYGEIVDRDRSQTAFIAGWMNRMKEFA